MVIASPEFIAQATANYERQQASALNTPTKLWQYNQNVVQQGFERSGTAYQTIEAGSTAPQINFSGIDPEFKDWFQAGGGPTINTFDAAGFKDPQQMQDELDQLYSGGGYIAADDWRLTGEVPEGFDPNTKKPWGVGELLGASGDSTGYWESIARADKTQLTEEQYQSNYAAAMGNLQLGGGGTSIFGPDEGAPDSVLAAQNARRDWENNRWVAAKKNRTPGFILSQMATLAAMTATAGTAMFPGAGFAALGAQAGAPSTLAGAFQALPSVAKQFSFTNTLANAAFNPGALTPAEIAAGGANAGSTSLSAEFANPVAFDNGTIGNLSPTASQAAGATGIAGAASANPVLWDSGTIGNLAAPTASTASTGATLASQGTSQALGIGGTTAGAGQIGFTGGSFANLSPAANVALTTAGGTAAAGGVAAGGAAATTAATGAGNVGWLSTASNFLTSAAPVVNAGLGLASLGAGIYGAVAGAGAAKDAANAQVQGIESSNALLRDIYEQNREDLAPYRETGTRALGELENIALNQDFSNFETSPGYEFRLSEGQKAQERGAAARGLTLSGRGIKELERFAQGTASSEFGNYWNRIAGLAGIGQTAAGQTASAGQGYGTAAGQNLANAGTARASGYVGSSNAISDSISNLMLTNALRGS